METILEMKVHSAAINDLHLDAILCITCGRDGFVRLLDRVQGKIIFSYGTELGIPFLCLLVSSVHEIIYAVSEDGKAHRLPLYNDERDPTDTGSKLRPCHCDSSTSWSLNGLSLASRITLHNERM